MTDMSIMEIIIDCMYRFRDSCLYNPVWTVNNAGSCICYIRSKQAELIKRVNLNIFPNILLLIERGHIISYETACAPSEDSDQADQSLRRPAENAWILGYQQSALRRLGSECADSQTDPGLRRAHMKSCRKCCGSAQLPYSPPDKAHWGNCVG